METEEGKLCLYLGDVQTQHHPKPLISLINDYFAPEVLNDWECSSCHNMGGTHFSHIVAAPDLLVIMLVRHAVDWTTGTASKREDIVNITPRVELSRFYFDAGARRGKLNYELVAVTKQMGTLDRGHYRAYGKQPNGRWKQADNDKITNSSFYEATRGDSPRQEPFTPYQLFYKRVFSSTC